MGDLVERSAREVNSFMYVSPRQLDTPPIARVVVVLASPEAHVAARGIEPFAALAPVRDAQARITPYFQVVAPTGAEHSGRGLGDTRSGLLTHITDQAAETNTRQPSTQYLHFRQPQPPTQIS